MNGTGRGEDKVTINVKAHTRRAAESWLTPRAFLILKVRLQLVEEMDLILSGMKDQRVSVKKSNAMLCARERSLRFEGWTGGDGRVGGDTCRWRIVCRLKAQ